ncbi:ANTAR domain-containing protein [Mycolicibacterium septicum DSM 44393]|uniref:ANTAR domain-containing protein n=1 Tax=Mycolicibacterium septicum DSM 44393 TaxID=1341646 RepID=A0A7X6RZP2_9MYCO|nr:ANTAR domain-containing protein [Mycolicibacterium septicum]NKZ15789.1 ANTAR domain-containing protein [Mycolicibacterium septicum DSM 44393]
MSEVGRRSDATSRRVIDLAIGILMGLRGCSEQQASEDLFGAVHDTGISLGAVARALMNLVEDSEVAFPHRSEAVQRWGHLIRGRVSATNGTSL